MLEWLPKSVCAWEEGVEREMEDRGNDKTKTNERL